MRIAIDNARMHSAANQVSHQLSSTICTGDDQFGIEPFLEATGRIGTQSQSNRGTAHIGCIEVCRLQQHRRRLVIDLADSSAHYTGNSRWPFWIGNEQHISRQLALYIVERCKLLALLSTTHDDVMLAYQIIVERVQRLTKLQHDIVGNVNDIVDGAHTCRQESPPHPTWGWTNLDVTDDTRSVTRTQVRVFDCDLGHLCRRCAMYMQNWLRSTHFLPRQRRYLPRNTNHRRQVPAMRLDRELHHHLAQHIDQLLSNLSLRVQNVDARMIVSQSKLTRRTEHPL